MNPTLDSGNAGGLKSGTSFKRPYKNRPASTDHLRRVEYDGGTVRNSPLLDSYIRMLQDNNIPMPVVCIMPEAAVTKRVSGVNEYAAKAHSLFTPKEVLGPELIVAEADRNFSSDTTYWAKDTGTTISGGTANFINVSQGQGINKAIGLSIGKVYKFEYTVTGSNIKFRAKCGSGGAGIERTVAGTYTEVLTCTASSLCEFTSSNGTCNFSIDNVSVKEVLIQSALTDASQTTANSQPAIGGNIAPNEKLCLKNVNGDSRFLTHPSVSFGATDKWTVQTTLRWDGNTDWSTYAGDGSVNNLLIIKASDNKVGIRNSLGDYITFTLSNTLAYLGKRTTIHIVSNGGSASLYINGSLIQTLSGTTSIALNRLLAGHSTVTRGLQGCIKHHSIFKDALTQAQITTTSDWLKAQFPEIPTVQIGAQQWATSNFEAVCTPQGNLIAEVQVNGFVEKVVNGGFDSDTGWVKGAGWTISGGLLNVNATSWGGVNILSPSPVANKWFKFTYTIVSKISGTNLQLYIGDGNTVTASVNVGTYTYYLKGFTSNNIISIGSADFVGSIDNVSVQEIGWAGSTELYDAIYAATAGTVEQKTYAACKAAAMWSHYNNDLALGAIYGKLYNWYAVKLLQMDIDYYNAANPATPWGYRVPADADFTTLQTTLGGSAVAGGKMKVAGTAYWNAPNTGADNSSGFSALGTGTRVISGVFTSLKNENFLYSSISSSILYIDSGSSSIIIANHFGKATGISIRLIKT